MGTDLWKQQYESERMRLIEALGKVIDGGIIESSQHIGSTSVPGMYGSQCVDIGMTVWPFPLEADPRSRLEALGYQIMDGFGESPQQRFRHTSNSFQLFLLEPGVKEWYDFVLIGDYLRHNDQKCTDVSAKKKDPALDKEAFFAELIPEAHKWWIEYYGFSMVEFAANELANAPFEWYISGGWAIDLFLGSVHRMHHDVDFIIPRAAQLEMQKYMTERGWKLVTPFQKRLETWPPHMRLELPRHQVHAHRGDEFVEFLLTDMDETWQYRREPSIIRAKSKMSLRTESGIRYLAPELVLLFKSRNTGDHERPKDEIDFEHAFPFLELERRAWLYWALTATTPNHPWIKLLAAP
ncbi:MAG: GrpB family protein [Anaerolineales bacterium]